MDLFHCLGNLACFSCSFTILMINGDSMYIYLLTNSDGIGSTLHDVDFNLPTLSCISFFAFSIKFFQDFTFAKINMWFVFTKVPQLTSNVFYLVYVFLPSINIIIFIKLTSPIIIKFGCLLKYWLIKPGNSSKMVPTIARCSSE